jgi:hypothetical protein
MMCVSVRLCGHRCFGLVCTDVEGIGVAEDWLDSWVTGVNTHAAQAVELSDRVATLSGVAQNPDGSVTVTVGCDGQVQALHLENSACELGGPALARQIMSVLHAAQADLSSRVTDAVRAMVGADTETSRAVVASFHTRFPSPEVTDHDGDLSADHDGAVSEVRVSEVRDGR